MRFRPLPGLTAAAIPALVLLAALGVWQTQRAQWKAELIRELEAAEARPAAPLGERLCAGAAGPVTIDRSPEAETVRIYGAGPEGQPGWLVVQAVSAPPCDGGTGPVRVLAQAGFETLDGARRDAPQRLMLEPWPEAGAFTPRNDPEAGQYYRFEAGDLAAAFGLAPGESLAPVWARWEARSALERARTPPATHIGYALTWFGLAAALLAIYAAMHVRAGRLGR